MGKQKVRTLEIARRPWENSERKGRGRRGKRNTEKQGVVEKSGEDGSTVDADFKKPKTAGVTHEERKKKNRGRKPLLSRKDGDPNGKRDRVERKARTNRTKSKKEATTAPQGEKPQG